MICRRQVVKYESMVNYLNVTDSVTQTKESRINSSNPDNIEITPSKDSLQQKLLIDTSDNSDGEEAKHVFENRVIAGLWGIHRLEKNPWSANVRPFKRLKHRNDLKLNNVEKKGTLSKRMIACGLTYLESSPYDLRYALCKCKLPEMAIVDISALRPYHYIQYLDLSHNKIVSLNALSEMPYLQYLDVSHNCIAKAFDFNAPLYLTTVNYSNNKILRIPRLDAYWSMTNLDLSFNCIHEIRGMDTLRFLVDLNLSHNNIKMLANLSNLRLIKLDLSHNKISIIETEERGQGFSTLSYLTNVDFSGNKLKSLGFLQDNQRLEDINISHNLINDLLEIYYLRNMMDLKKLTISNNLLCQNSHFKALCIRTLPKLRELNDESVTVKDRIEVATKEDFSPLIPAHISRMQLLLLEQLNNPKIGAHVCPYGEPTPSILAILGPPASKKKYIVNKFVEHSEFLKLGISHTTRTKRKSEIEGKDYYYTKYDTFVQMVRNAEFLTVTEFNGHLYGIAHSELEKAINSILVFYCDLATGLILKMAGLHPKLVLAMPREEKVHIQWLKETYFFDENVNTAMAEIVIKTCPTLLKEVVNSYEQMENDSLFNINEDDPSIDVEEFTSNVYLDSLKEFHLMHPIYQNIIKDNLSTKVEEADEYSLLSPIEESKKHQESQSVSSKAAVPVFIGHHEKQVLNWKNYEETNESIDLPRSDLDQTDSPRRTSIESPMTKDTERLNENIQNGSVDEVLNKDVKENSQSSGDIPQSGILKRDSQGDSLGDSDQTIEEPNKSIQTDDKESSNFSLGSEISSMSEDDVRKSSTQENSVERERSSSGKRVSFNYDRLTEDETSYDPNFFDQNQRQTIKSVSNTHILRTMQNRFFDNPLLSVLSASELVDKEETSAQWVQPKTAYTTLAERFDALKADKLGPFLISVMSLRKELLELHYSNPGLFQTVIFTDDNTNDCIEILKGITKNIVQTRSVSNKQEPEEYSDHNEFVLKRLNNMEIFYPRFTKLYEDLEI